MDCPHGLEHIILAFMVVAATKTADSCAGRFLLQIRTMRARTELAGEDRRAGDEQEQGPVKVLHRHVTVDP